jgi:hypothetical protein
MSTLWFFCWIFIFQLLEKCQTCWINSTQGLCRVGNFYPLWLRFGKKVQKQGKKRSYVFLISSVNYLELVHSGTVCVLRKAGEQKKKLLSPLGTSPS